VTPVEQFVGAVILIVVVSFVLAAVIGNLE
jgi:hypothetical protein